MRAAGVKQRYLPLRAGRLSCSFDVVTGGLRDLCLGDLCVWRELIVLVRDDRWQAVPGHLADVQTEISTGSFEVHFRCCHQSPPIEFEWRGRIRGTASGDVRYEFTGEALSAFAANRIGFCLLHPSELYAGRPNRQTRRDGRIISGQFPRLVEPQIVGRYSMHDLQGLAHEIREGLWGHAEFEGDQFETEDQRNWTDASFKTYCTPLAKPFPVVLQPGESRAQAVSLSIRHLAADRVAADAPAVAKKSLLPAVSRAANSLRLPAPRFGISLAPIGERFLPADQVPLSHLCADLAVDFLRFDLALPGQSERQAHAIGRFTEMAALAERAGCRLELVVQLPSTGDIPWQQLGEAVRRHARQLVRILLYRRGLPVTLRKDVVALRREVIACSIPIGGGSDANFCELNREQALGEFPIDEVDFVAWSINPQVHATDDLSLVETLRSLGDVVETARLFADGKPLLVTPITLKPRFNAVETRTSDEDGWSLPPADRRQTDEICAAWALAAWQSLASSGVASTTWFEAFGSRGVACIDERGESPRLYPVGQAFRQLATAGVRDAERLSTTSYRLVATLLHTAAGPRLLLTNLSGQRQRLTVDPSVWNAAGGGECSETLEPYEVKIMDGAKAVGGRGTR